MPFKLLRIIEWAKGKASPNGRYGSSKLHCDDTNCEICMAKQKREIVNLKHVDDLPAICTIGDAPKPKPTCLERMMPCIWVTWLLLLLLLIVLFILAMLGFFCFRSDNLIVEDQPGRLDVTEYKCSAKRDLCIILDSSGSINPFHWKDGRINKYGKALDFLTSVVEPMSLSYSESHVSMVIFSDSAKVVFQNLYDQKAVQYGIMSTQYLDGNTYTDLGLDTALNQVYEPYFRKQQSGVLPLFLILTDGGCNSPFCSKANALQEPVKRIADKGIITIAIGIGSNITTNELEILANGKKEHVLSTTSFDTLQLIFSEFEKSMCSESAKVEPDGGSNEFSVEEKEITYVKVDQIPDEGVTVSFDEVSGNVDGYASYASRQQSEKEGFYYYDSRIKPGHAKHFSKETLRNGELYLGFKSDRSGNNVFKMKAHHGNSAAIMSMPLLTILFCEIFHALL